MFAFIWVILLFADKGSGTSDSSCAKEKYDIVQSESNATAEDGRCVLPCYLTAEDGFEVKSVIWYKHNGTSNKIFDFSENPDSEFKKWVSLQKSDLKMKNCSIIINNISISDSGSYQVVVTINGTANGCTLISNFTVTVTERQRNSSSQTNDTEVTCNVGFNGGNTTEEKKIDSKKLKISGATAVKQGDTLNLTCSSDSSSAPSISWTKSDYNRSLNKEFENKTTKASGSATLTIPNVTAEHYGQYICTAIYVNENITETINVTSGVVPRILNSSGCVVQSEVLTCVCISEGFPLPIIKWQHLENHTEYPVTTSVSKTTVSIITVSLKHSHNTSIECVSNNNIGVANLSITIKKSQLNDLFKELLIIIQEKKVIIAALTGFVIGIILSAIIACLVKKSCRKKQKTSENMSENLEMVTTEAVPMIDADQAAVYDGIHEPEAVEGEAQSAGQSVPHGDVAPKEVEYSNIDFSAIKNRNPEEAEKTQDTTDTEYAEIKRQENAQEDSEMLGASEEKEVMTGEDNDAKNDAKKAEEEGGEDVALYSSVDEIMG